MKCFCFKKKVDIQIKSFFACYLHISHSVRSTFTIIDLESRNSTNSAFKGEIISTDKSSLVRLL